jgi:hypothetical protein
MPWRKHLGKRWITATGLWFPLLPDKKIAGQCFSSAFVANTTKQAPVKTHDKSLKNID